MMSDASPNPRTDVRTVSLAKDGSAAPTLCMIAVSATLGREPHHATAVPDAPPKVIVTVVPWARTLVSPIVPPQLATSRRAIARPRPDPLEVVENAGSKTREIGRASC